MPLFLLFAFMLLAVTALDGPTPAAGFTWDFLNGLGFAALAGLVYLGWDSESPARQPALRLHGNLAIVTAVLAAGHVVGLAVADPVVLEYLQPKAPWYMHAGTVAFLCLLGLAATSHAGPRRRVYRRFASFRRWHLGLSVAALGLAAWHVLAPGFYAGTPAERVLLALIVLGLPALAFLLRRRGVQPPGWSAVSGARQADRGALLGGAAVLGLSCAFAAWKLV